MKTMIFENQIKFFDRYRYGVMSAYLVIGSCIGSAAALLILKVDSGPFYLAISAVATMASNAVCIAQGAPKLCVYTFYIATFINIILIIAHAVIL